MRLWVLALLVVPLVGASQVPAVGIWNPQDSTPVELWLHCHGIQDCPVNTQVPDDRYHQTEAAGLTTLSESCQTVPGIGLVGRGHHTYYAYSSPSFVQYDVDEGGKPRYNAAEGLAYDVHLDLAVTPMFHYYVRVAPVRGDSGAEALPLVAPQVRVMATWRTGDTISVSHAEMEQGTMIAQGLSAAVDLSPLVDHPQVSHHSVDGAHVYGFHFPLHYADKDGITKEESFHLRIDVYTEVPGCNDPMGDGYVMTDTVQPYTGGDLWPRLEASLFNPLRIEYLHPQFVQDDLVIHAAAISPWGNYDVAGMTLEVDGPGQTAFELVSLVHRYVEWDHHRDPMQGTWVWQGYRGGTPGSYDVHLAATNLQGTAVAEAGTRFQLGADRATLCTWNTDPQCFEVTQDTGAETVPAVGIVPLLSLLAAALLLRRR